MKNTGDGPPSVAAVFHCLPKIRAGGLPHAGGTRMSCARGSGKLLFPGMEDIPYRMIDRLSRMIHRKRVAIIGLGNRSLGDDGIGPRLVERLEGRVDALLYESRNGLETVLSAIPADRPEIVVVVKAIDVGRLPGTMVLLTGAMLENGNVGENANDVRCLVRYIEKESRTPTVLLVIQPETSALENTPSDGVNRSCSRLERFFLDKLRKDTPPIQHDTPLTG